MRNKNVRTCPEVSSTAQLAQVRTETLYGVKRRMNLRLGQSLLAKIGVKITKTQDLFFSYSMSIDMTLIQIINLCHSRQIY